MFSLVLDQTPMNSKGKFVFVPPPTVKYNLLELEPLRIEDARMVRPCLPFTL